MNFLLLSQLPRVDESRRHYDAMLNLETRETRVQAVAGAWRRLAALFLRSRA